MAGPPDLPAGGRWSVRPSALRQVAADAMGAGHRFVAEIGVGIVHHSVARPAPALPPPVADLHRRLKHEFDPDDRLNPGLAGSMFDPAAARRR